eukprot:1152400-Pelagomonas_calceolata.AAC.4
MQHPPGAKLPSMLQDSMHDTWKCKKQDDTRKKGEQHVLFAYDTRKEGTRHMLFRCNSKGI